VNDATRDTQPGNQKLKSKDENQAVLRTKRFEGGSEKGGRFLTGGQGIREGRSVVKGGSRDGARYQSIRGRRSTRGD